MIVILLGPLFHPALHIFDNSNRKVLGFWISFPVATVKDCCHFIQTDIAQGNRCTTVSKELVYLIILAQTLAKSPILIENRCIGWTGFLGPLHSVDQSILSDVHPLVKKFPEFIQIPLRFKRNPR